ncbi:transglycosylase domain-containing protein [Gordonia sp. VNK21]|uniref:transglycosylase domain-containing protein n=1 Tax=Gordonia sp. VNK21 TaxID=3382483 RepID=UPI0038D46ACA
MTSETKRTGEDPGAPRRRRIKIIAWVAGVAAGIVPLVAIVGVLAFLITYLTVTVPAPGDIKQNQVATIVDSKGGVIDRVVPPEGNRIDVKYDQIPTSMVEAVKAAEDRDFDSNSGFSVTGFGRAALGKLRGTDAGGGSTITQQYVKNAMVGDEVSYKRKFKELAIATKMSRQWAKEDIMTAYLNTIYFGRGAYGIAAAAKAYFNIDLTKPTKNGKPALNDAQSALLAGIIRGPSLYDPAVDEQLAIARWTYVLDGMVKIGALPRSEFDEMTVLDGGVPEGFPKTIKPKAVETGAAGGPNGLIRRQVLAELDQLGITEQEIRTDGLRITTSIDPKVQKALVSASRDKLSGEPDDLRTASVSIDPNTGGIVGYYGGEDGQGWDYASTGLQTGSVFKVFALVAALEQDIPLSKTYSSDPYTNAQGLVVENSEGESCGTCNLATAMKMSLNTVYYRLMMDLKHGADDVADAAHRAGVAESFGDVQHTLANANGHSEGGVVLGQYDSRVLDLASAYATLAASGIYREPFLVQKVETSSGEVRYEREKQKGKRVFSAAVADNVTAALEPVAAYSNGNSLYDSSLGARPSASKTGTAQLGNTGNNRYAWMVGYTPQLSTAVWVGTEKGNEPLRNYGGAAIYGSGLPAQIWKAAMDQALAGDPIKNFPDPDPIGGQAGVPYEPPPVTTYEDYPTQTNTRTRQRPRVPVPTQGDDGNVTVAPGWTIPWGDGGGNGNGNGTGNGNGNGTGNGGGNSGGGSGDDGTEGESGQLMGPDDQSPVPAA